MHKENQKIGNSKISFTAPQARVLVVDDIVTNLSVAKGLLSAYKIRIDCCDSGSKALRLVEKTRYDIVFLDHFMPGMDGIETAAAVRALDRPYARDLPLIALTANAVSGIKEMFLEKGFNDYLAKPIEIAEMKNILEKWIPKSKQLQEAENDREPEAGKGRERPLPVPPGSSQRAPAGKALLPLEGLDTARGIRMTGGTEAGYRGVLAAYYRDVLKRLPLLENPPGKEDLSPFVIQVHALKGASASIGAAELSKEAGELETAGKAGDLPALREKLPAFRERLTRLMAELKKSGLLEKPGAEEPADPGAEDASLLPHFPQFVSLKKALEEDNLREIDRIVQELEKEAPAGREGELLSDISDKLLMAEYEEAREVLEKFLG